MSPASPDVVSCIGTTGSGAIGPHSSTTVWACLFAGFFIGPVFPSGLTWMVNTGHAHGNRFAYVVAASMVGMALAPIGLGFVDVTRQQMSTASGGARWARISTSTEREVPAGMRQRRDDGRHLFP